MKICTECKHCVPNKLDTRYSICDVKDFATTCPVNGVEELTFCSHARMNSNMCGSEGKKWEQKPVNEGNQPEYAYTGRRTLGNVVNSIKQLFKH